jgi:hypothetical protein
MIALIKRKNMNKQLFGLAIGAAVFLTGCIATSIHPFYTSKDVVFEPGLLGQWTNTEANQRWAFQRAGAEAYHLIYVSEEGKTNLATAHLFKLNGQSFLDFVSAEPECEVLPPPAPSHFLLRVTQLAPSVKLALLNHDWLKNSLEKDPKLLRHALVGDKPDDTRVVLTGETPELQQFLRAHLETAQAWQDPFELKRASAR